MMMPTTIAVACRRPIGRSSAGLVGGAKMGQFTTGVLGWNAAGAARAPGPQARFLRQCATQVPVSLACKHLNENGRDLVRDILANITQLFHETLPVDCSDLVEGRLPDLAFEVDLYAGGVSTQSTC